MYYVRERAMKICEALLARREERQWLVDRWERAEGFFPNPRAATQGNFAPFDCGREICGVPDTYHWFKTEITIPLELDGEEVWLSLIPQRKGWDAVNPQLLVFVNGVAVQGGDMNHRTMRLTPRSKAGERFTVELQAYTGRSTGLSWESWGPLTLRPYLFAEEEESLGLYYDLWVPAQSLERLAPESPEYIAVEKAVNDAVNLLDLRRPGSKEYFASVKMARKYLARELYGHSQVKQAVLRCVGHTHIDVAWLWTVAETRKKAARSFATVLELMERYPEYRFMSSQPQLYEFVKEDQPELYERIKARVREGRWEPEGGMWLEADCNVTGGESLVRQILHGKRFFQEEFGVENRVLWLPDVFGYSAALPQILKKSGIDYFMTTKIAWNQFNKLPCDTFRWRGLDGTEVLTHLITAQNANQPEGSFFTTYNGELDGVSALRSWERYQQKELNNELLYAFGYGDGGGGPTQEMLEACRRLEQGVPGVPAARMTGVAEFFDDLSRRVWDDPRLPCWSGELYLEYHRGTYTSMARNKRDNRRGEQLLQDAEFISVWAERESLPYPAQELHESWRTLLLNQFHDILPGSSIKEVYEDTRRDYGRLLSQGEALIAERLQAVADETAASPGDATVFNTLSFDRRELIELPGEAGGWAGENGPLPTQRLADGRLLVLTGPVPGRGMALLTRCGESEWPSPFEIGEHRIVTPFYEAEFDESFELSRLFDREAGREVLRDGERGNVLEVFEDRPMNYDCWDIDIYHTEKRWTVGDVQEAHWTERGPLRATLLLRRRFLESVIEQEIRFYAHDRRVDFSTRVDWRESQLLLKMLFPVDVRAEQATYETQFGNLTRPTHENTSWEVAQFEVCGHNWADLSEDGYGVSLLNDSKYGYSIRNGEMRLTLIKSGVQPNPTADQEVHFFTYSLCPHLEGWRQADIPRRATALNMPFYTRLCRGGGTLPPKEPLFTAQPENLQIETVKRAEDSRGVILRLYECHNRRSTLRLRWSNPEIEAVECDLLERPLSPIPVRNGHLELTVRPYEIKTLRILPTEKE